MAVKKDCFAYNRSTGSCNALRVMQCDFKECNFYKSKEENCRKCREANGRTKDCNECRSIMAKA